MHFQSVYQTINPITTQTLVLGSKASFVRLSVFFSSSSVAKKKKKKKVWCFGSTVMILHLLLGGGQRLAEAETGGGSVGLIPPSF